MSVTPLAQRIRQLSERGHARNIDQAIQVAGEVFTELETAAERSVISPWKHTAGFLNLSLLDADGDYHDIDQAFVWHGEDPHLDGDAPFLHNETRALAVARGANEACSFTDIDPRSVKQNEPGQFTLSPLDRVINAVNRDVELPPGLTHVWSNNLLGDALHGLFVLQLEDDHLGIFVGRTMGGVDRVALLGLQPLSASWSLHSDDRSVADIGALNFHLIEEDEVWVTSSSERASLDWWQLFPSHVRTLMNGTLLQYCAGVSPDLLTPSEAPDMEGIRLLPRRKA